MTLIPSLVRHGQIDISEVKASQVCIECFRRAKLLIRCVWYLTDVFTLVVLPR